MATWVTVSLLCWSAIARAENAVTNAGDTQSVGDAPQGVKLDNYRHPVTLSIRDGGHSTRYEPQDEVYFDDQGLFYSNEWKPIILPSGFSYFNDRSRYQIGSDRRIISTVFRRPVSDPNKTDPIVERGQITSTQLPSTAIFLYPRPRPVNLQPEENTVEKTSTILQNASNLAMQFLLSNPEASNSEVDLSKPLPSENPVLSSEGSVITDPEFDIKTQGQVPTSVPVYTSPYTIWPFENPFFQSITQSNLNAKTDSETRANLPLLNDYSEVESHSVSDHIHVNEAPLEKNRPREPLNTDQFAIEGYPFGIAPTLPFASPYSPPFMPSDPITSGHSYILSATSRGISFNPSAFPESTDGQTGDQATAPSLPLTVANSMSTTKEPTSSKQNVDAISQLDAISHLDAIQPGPDAPSQTREETLVESIMPYEFRYDLNDGHGTDQYRKEASDSSGVVKGSYGYRDMSGVYRLVNYIADEDGFRASVKSNEPGVASSGSADVVFISERPPASLPIPEVTGVAESEVVVADDETAESGIESEAKN